jgi:putative ABC transport system permease protein
MLSNYLKIGIRTLLRHKFFSFINIFGLAVAMSISMGIIMLVADQFEHDRYNSKRNRIYRVNTYRVNSNGVDEGSQRNASSPLALRRELLEKYTGFEKVVRLRWGFGNDWLELENQNVNIPLAGFYADPEVFDLFEYEFQYGDPVKALKEPFSVVLTRNAANKLFTEENPVGQIIKVGDIGTYTVTGVLKETNKKSHIIFEALASMSTLENNTSASRQREFDDFTKNWNHWTYIQCEAGQSQVDIQQSLDKIYDEHVAVITNPDIVKMRFSLQGLNDITPGPMLNNAIGPLLPWVFVYTLGGLALIILLTSCFNFTNLSMARSLTRAREIGVRKVTGAARWQIFIQFLSESIVVAILALALAAFLMFLIKPLILQLNIARMLKWDLQFNLPVFFIFVIFSLVVGVLAGLFPAIILSGFRPVTVLKNISNLKVFSRVGIRKILLVSQFSLSLFFILSTIVMHKQLTFFIERDHGFNMEKNIMVRLNSTSPETLKAELLKFSDITSVTAASHVAAAGASYISGFKKGIDEEEWTVLSHFEVDEDYLENMNLKLTAGKFFMQEQAASNKEYIVINEQAVNKLQYNSPFEALGKELISQADSSRKTIIGVVADYNHRDLTRVITPMALMYDPEHFNLLQVRYSGSYQNATEIIEKAWAMVNPGLKADYKEVETEIRKFYEIVFGDFVKILSTIALLAIVISCLGLLGMATYTTETRMREISIRKVLGSDDRSLVLLLSRGFIIVLTVAVVIGATLTYFVNNLWLDMIAYHTTIDLSVFAQGIAILLLFGILTISSQTIRAMFVNPVKTLKNE